MKVAEVSMVGIHSVLGVEKTVFWEREWKKVIIKTKC